MTTRDREIVALYEGGVLPGTAFAERYGVTEQRIYQILRAHDVELKARRRGQAAAAGHPVVRIRKPKAGEASGPNAGGADYADRMVDSWRGLGRLAAEASSDGEGAARVVQPGELASGVRFSRPAPAPVHAGDERPDVLAADPRSRAGGGDERGQSQDRRRRLPRAVSRPSTPNRRPIASELAPDFRGKWRLGPRMTKQVVQPNSDWPMRTTKPEGACFGSKRSPVRVWAPRPASLRMAILNSRCSMGAPDGRERRYGRSRRPGPDSSEFSTPRNRVSLF